MASSNTTKKANLNNPPASASPSTNLASGTNVASGTSVASGTNVASDDANEPAGPRAPLSWRTRRSVKEEDGPVSFPAWHDSQLASLQAAESNVLGVDVESNNPSRGPVRVVAFVLMSYRKLLQ